jgi:transposase
MVTVGFDLHKQYITACALDAFGNVVAECRRLDSSLDAIVVWLEALGEPVRVAMEATFYWHWLERQLTARGFDVGVAHPYQVKLICQARTKTDPIDARKLAELARVNFAAGNLDSRSGHPRAPPTAARAGLPRQAAHGDAESHSRVSHGRNLRCPELDLYSKAGQAWLASVELPSIVRGHVTLILENHALLTSQIQGIDRHIKGTVWRDEIARRRQTIPGIGPFGALLLQAEVGPIARIGSAQELAA